MSIIIIFAGWMVFAAGLCGWGWLLARLLASGLRVNVRDHADFETLFWMGWATALGVAQICHLFLPIGIGVAVGFWLIGLAACIIAWKALRSSRTSRRNAGLWMLALPFLVLLAREAIQGPANWDSGYYHFATIRWTETYRAVPGLGNLQGHFAFNQSYFLFVALMDVPPLRGHGYQFANSLLCAAIFCQTASALWQAARLPRVPPPDIWLQLALALALCFEMHGPEGGMRISSPTPDLAVALLPAVLLVRLVRFIFEQSRTPQDWQFASLALLSIATVTIKLSALAFVGAIFMVACVVVARRKRPDPLVRPLLVVTGIAAFLVIPWVIRGIILSGYPFYPSLIAGMPVDWKIPAADARGMYDSIVGWGRQPGPDYRSAIGHWNWLDAWVRRIGERIDVRVFLGTLGGALLAWGGVFWRQRRWWREPSLFWIAPLLPSVAGLAFWFGTAPDVRFLGLLPWMLPAWLVVWLLQARQKAAWRLMRTRGFPALVFPAPPSSLAAPRPRMCGRGTLRDWR